LGELGAGLDVELGVDVAQVVLDGLGAEEQGGRRLTNRLAADQVQGDLQFARGQLARRAGSGTMDRRPGGDQLVGRLVGPRPRTEPAEIVMGTLQVWAGVHPSAEAT